jgi:hypothetical protein
MVGGDRYGCESSRCIPAPQRAENIEKVRGESRRVSSNLGGYGWTALTYSWTSAKLDKFENNHLKHIEDRLDTLEKNEKIA